MQFSCVFYLETLQLAGRNSHHIIEATFKAFARALRQATEHDLRRHGSVPRFVSLNFFEEKLEFSYPPAACFIIISIMKERNCKPSN